MLVTIGHESETFYEMRDLARGLLASNNKRNTKRRTTEKSYT